MYGVGLRTVAAHNEFTLRSSVHNPLAYDPAVTYIPWNDNDKPTAAQGTRPRRDENFPLADIGGTGAVATAGRFTERDMRHVGFANGNSNAIRKWITRVARHRGWQRHLPGDQPVPRTAGRWNATNLRWEQPIG